MGSSEMIELEILGLTTTPGKGGAYALVLTERTGNRRLPIIIGAFEAQAIALELENIKPPRPMTHDLVKNLLLSFESSVSSVLINELADSTFYAKIRFDRNGESLELDSRPSDAIAVAIRFSAPIFVDPSIMDAAGIVTEETEEEEGKPAHSQAEPEKGVEVEPAAPLSPLDSLKRDLQTAIETENYEKAARLRDQIQKLKG